MIPRSELRGLPQPAIYAVAAEPAESAVMLHFSAPAVSTARVKLHTPVV